MENNQQQKKQPYYINVPMTRTYFSAKRPSGPKSYAFMNVDYYNDKIVLKFKSAITSENVIDLNCYLQPSKAFDLSQWLEGFMGRRRDAFASGQSYDASEELQMNSTMFKDGEDVPTGLLVCKAEMFENVPRLSISYTNYEKNQTIEIVFASNVPKGKFETNKQIMKIDYVDLEAYDFVTTFKELQNPMIPMMYRITNSAVSSLSRYISAVFGNNRQQRFNNNQQSQGPVMDDNWDGDVF